MAGTRDAEPSIDESISGWVRFGEGPSGQIPAPGMSRKAQSDPESDFWNMQKCSMISRIGFPGGGKTGLEKGVVLQGFPGAPTPTGKMLSNCKYRG